MREREHAIALQSLACQETGKQIIFMLLVNWIRPAFPLLPTAGLAHFLPAQEHMPVEHVAGVWADAE